MSPIDIAKEVIFTEIDGLKYMASRLDGSFLKAIDTIYSSSGRTIICGMGKSGIVGKKIAASFASTGTPSFFMHPGEAFHGDLGMVKPEDVFIAISNSGETDEVLKLLPFLRDNNNSIISITGNVDSTLARNSHCHLDISVPREACPHQLAPTTSTTATLVMGDALTVALMEIRNFKPENFARFHPGGSLGRRLLSKVKDEMCLNYPVVHQYSDFTEVVHRMTDGALGLVLVDSCNGFEIITDGDLRRAMKNYGKDVFDLFAHNISTKKPVTIQADLNVQSAFDIMERNKVTSLLVEDCGVVVGVLKK